MANDENNTEEIAVEQKVGQKVEQREGQMQERSRAPYQGRPQGGGKPPFRGGGGGGGKGRGYFRKKVCRFCTQKFTVDYKNPEGLRRFITDRGKILPRRITGTCAKHQRVVAREIKKARILAFLPFVKK